MSTKTRKDLLIKAKFQAVFSAIGFLGSAGEADLAYGFSHIPVSSETPREESFLEQAASEQKEALKAQIDKFTPQHPGAFVSVDFARARERAHELFVAAKAQTTENIRRHEDVVHRTNEIGYGSAGALLTFAFVMAALSARSFKLARNAPDRPSQDNDQAAVQPS